MLVSGVFLPKISEFDAVAIKGKYFTSLYFSKVISLLPIPAVYFSDISMFSEIERLGLLVLTVRLLNFLVTMLFQRAK